MTKLKQLFSDIIFVSRMTNVNKKKLRILFSVLLANFTVLFDILVILVFAYIIEDSNSEPSIYIKFIIENFSWDTIGKKLNYFLKNIPLNGAKDW